MTTEAPPDPTLEMVVMWRNNAYHSLSMVQTALDQGFAYLANTRRMADGWDDQFWAHCGYDKEATLALLDSLEKLARAYRGEGGLAGTHDYRADAGALKTQTTVEVNP
jgi:hypothetical protein